MFRADDARVRLGSGPADAFEQLRAPSSFPDSFSYFKTNAGIPDTHFPMPRLILPALLLWSLAAAVLGEEKNSQLKFPSPDKRFALQITPSSDSDEAKAELIEKGTGK